MIIISVVTVVVLAVLCYVLYVMKSTARAVANTRKPLGEWLDIYQATSEHMRPAQACALLSQLCSVGIGLRIMDVEQGRGYKSVMKHCGYERWLEMMLSNSAQYADDPRIEKESAARTLLAMSISASPDIGYAALGLK